MKAYSTDLRQKIVYAYERQLGTQAALAELFGVSVSFVDKLLRRYRTTGDLRPRPRGGGQPQRLDTAAQACITQWVQAEPDVTLAELCERSAQELGVGVSVPTMCRVLQSLGLPRKKSRSTRQSVTPKGSSTSEPATTSRSARSPSSA